MKFLDDIVPQSGETCLFSFFSSKPKKEQDPRTVWVDVHDPETLAKRQEMLEKQGRDIYFGLASFNDRSRKLDQISQLKTLWLDIDAGEEKHAKHPETTYPTQKAALTALYDWLDDSDMPDPTYIVSSGEGLHVYWGLRKSVDYARWKLLSRGLVSAVQEAGLLIDTGPSVNGAGVLRVPGTTHHKSGKTVEVLERGGLFGYDELQELFPAPPEEINPKAAKQEKLVAWFRDTFNNLPAHIERGMQRIQKVVKGAWEICNERDLPKKSFARLLQLSLQGKGCEQLAWMYENQASVEEPLWRAGLSIAYNCDDGDTAIHTLSDQHPEYSAAETAAKAETTDDKPYSCSQFGTLNSNGCKGCVFAKKIQSPINLAFERNIEVMDVEARNQMITEAREKIAAAKRESFSGWDDPELDDVRALAGKQELPELPFPYYFADSGAVMRTIDGGEDFMICPYPLYVASRGYNRAINQMAVQVIFGTPHDGDLEAHISCDQLNSSAETMKALGSIGLVENHKGRREAIVSFLQRLNRQAMDTAKAMAQYSNFGWTSDQSGFVYGDTLYESNGKERRLISNPETMALAAALDLPKGGRLGTWQEAVQLYSNPSMEKGLMVLALSMGAPLFGLIGQQGGLLHLQSVKSGSGKSTVCHLAMSIWGRCYSDPSVGAGLESLNQDTHNAVFAKMATLSHIPLMIDEITEMKSTDLTQLIYSFTQGRQRERMEASSNKLRTNTGSWAFTAFTTGNRSVVNQLESTGQMQEALHKRIFELDYGDVGSAVKLDKRMFKRVVETAIRENYGIAGHALINWLVSHQKEARELIDTVSVELDNRFGFTNTERFWESMCVCAISGLRLANQLGIWDMNEAPLLNLMGDLLNASRTVIDEGRLDPEAVLADFLSTHLSERLTMRAPGMLPSPNEMPRNSAVIRDERFSGHRYILLSTLRDWLRDRHVDSALVLNWLKQNHNGRLVRKNMMHGIDGSRASENRAHCVEFKVDFSANDATIEEQSKEDSYNEQLNRA